MTRLATALHKVRIESKITCNVYILYICGAARSDEHLGEPVGARAGDVGPQRVERHVQDALVELLAVRRDLLHARLGVQVPQPHGTVMAARQQEQPVGVQRQPRDGVQVRHHGVCAAPGHAVPEADVPVLVRRHQQRQRGVRPHAVRRAVARHAQHRLEQGE